MTLRMEGHAVHDDAFYVPKELFEEWAKRDPIERFRSWLRENAELTDEEEDEISAASSGPSTRRSSRPRSRRCPIPPASPTRVCATPEELDTPHHK